MLNKHKLFDQTLWIAVILSCALGLFSTLISSLFTLVYVFLKPIRNTSGPMSLYLWNSISGWAICF